MGQDRVKDPWEDDRIIENVKEKENEESGDENNETETRNSQSDNSGYTIIPNEIMETFDKEYEPTTTESEESVVSAKCVKARNKKQTTLTQTLKETNSNNLAKANNPTKMKLMPIRRQTRSMRKKQV